MSIKASAVTTATPTRTTIPPRSLLSRPRAASRRKLALGASALTALLLCGCGGGGSGTTGSNRSNSTPSGHLQDLAGAPGQPKAVWGAPTNGQAPRGVLIMIHGGSWSGLSPSAFQSMIATATVFRGLGFETLTVDYRRGAQGVDDVNRFYQQARRQVGSTPICAVGVSAGAHIALMLAVRNPDLRCVLDLAGPTDLPAFKTEPGGAPGYAIVVGAFGTGSLERLSPALQAGSIKAKLLLIYAQNDPLVPIQQGREMARADPAAKLIELPPGSAPFVHTGVGAPAKDSGVDPTAYARAQAAEVKFLDDAMAASG